MLDDLKRFAIYYSPHRFLFVLDFASAVVAGLLELAFPIAVTLFIDRLLPTNQTGLRSPHSVCSLSISSIPGSK